MADSATVYGDTSLFDLRLVFVADDAAVLDKSLRLFPDEGTEGTEGTDDAVITVTLRRYAVNDAPASHADAGSLYIVRDGFALVADAAGRRGEILYSDAGHPLLGEMIETVALYLAAQLDRTPLHASAVMLGATALVLAGRSGMGKSTLALAAARAGMPVLSDDTIYIQTAPCLCLWARTHAIHVFERDAPPGAAGPLRLRAGRWKKALPLPTPREKARRIMLCVLARGDRVALEQLSPDAAVAQLTTTPEPGYDFYGQRMADAVRALGQAGCYRLTLSRDPAAAIVLLNRHFGLAPA